MCVCVVALWCVCNNTSGFGVRAAPTSSSPRENHHQRVWHIGRQCNLDTHHTPHTTHHTPHTTHHSPHDKEQTPHNKNTQHTMVCCCITHTRQTFIAPQHTEPCVITPQHTGPCTGSRIVEAKDNTTHHKPHIIHHTPHTTHHTPHNKTTHDTPQTQQHTAPCAGSRIVEARGTRCQRARAGADRYGGDSHHLIVNVLRVHWLCAGGCILRCTCARERGYICVYTYV